MSPVRLIKRVLRLPLQDKLLVLEALVLLALARLSVVLLPFRWVARAFGKQASLTTEQGDTTQTWLIRRVGIVVNKVSRHVPWTSKCLDQALAAKIMLARRGISTTVYFGVMNDEQGELAAHAWLRSGNKYVTGGDIRDRYTVINTFADERV
jgi:hypothetical protein